MDGLGGLSFFFVLHNIPLCTRAEERAVGPFHGPGDPGLPLGPDPMRGERHYFPRGISWPFGPIDFPPVSYAGHVVEVHFGYQMVAVVVLGSANGNTDQLGIGMLVYVQYGVIGGQHGVSFSFSLFSF